MLLPEFFYNFFVPDALLLKFLKITGIIHLDNLRQFWGYPKHKQDGCQIKRDFSIGRCSSSHPNVLENAYVNSNNEVVSYNTISAGHVTGLLEMKI